MELLVEVFVMLTKNHNLISVKERTKIYRENDKILYEDEDGKQQEVPFNSSVSMNFWCFHPAVFIETEKLFHSFVEQNYTNIKSEFFIPLIAEDFMYSYQGTIKVIPTSAQWFGVTYKEDAPGVKASIDKLVVDGAYPSSLWG
ncbi:MAG: hypothetical protein WDM71_10100 [Ferruginibacter sp.]